MTLRTCLTFNDVSLVPNYSDLSSRSEVDLSTDCGWRKLQVGIISSPMDTVTGLDMIRAMRQAGGDGIHHRYCSAMILEDVARDYPIAVSPSVGLDLIKRIVGFINPEPVLVIDVAHGDSKPALDYAEGLVKLGATVVSGNIVTWQAAKRYYDVGVKIMRVGVGCGSSCSTRVVAGVGVPQITALRDIYGIEEDIKIISDGGLHSSGDIVKAFVAGADCVMTGRLLAGCAESLGVSNGDMVSYRGMASGESLDEAGKERNVEGVAGFVKRNGSVATVMDTLARGMRAGLAYVGARNIEELRLKAEFVQVTHNGHIEGMPRI